MAPPPGELHAAEAVSHSAYLARFSIAAVVPAYNEAAHIATVLRGLPAYLRHIIVVDDASHDDTAAQIAQVAASDPRVVLLRHEQNQGVGGAMITGLRKAQELGVQVVVKLDGDGQMSPENLPALLEPLLHGEADFTKGNRFRDFAALARMPALRRFGNMVLTFLTKAAVGYWNCFDPCNGYVALRGDLLEQLPLGNLARGYFFETSLLSELYILGAVVKDVPMPARYGNESSHLSVVKAAVEFPVRLLRCFVRRIVLRNFLFDFNMESVYLVTSAVLLTLGSVYGGLNWLYYALIWHPAPSGTVVISALLIILGFQLLLSAIQEDLRAVPQTPLAKGPLPFRPQPAAALNESQPAVPQS